MTILAYTGFGSGGCTGDPDSWNRKLRTESVAASPNTGDKLSVVSSPVYSGDYALRMNSGANNTVAHINLEVTDANNHPYGDLGGNTTVYAFTRFRCATLPGTYQPFFKMNRPSGSDDISLVLTSAGAVEVWSGDSALTTKELTATQTLSTNEWYTFQLKVVANGTCEFKMNDTSEGTFSDTDATAWENFAIGLVQGAQATACDWYYDMAACRNDDWFDDGIKCIRLRPNANGTNTAWSGTYADIDEAPIDGVAACTSSTTNDKESANLDAATGTIGSDDTINAIFARWIGLKSASQTTNCTGSIYSGGTEYEDVSSGENFGSTAWLTDSSNEFEKIYETDPNGGGAWTLSRLDSLEIGIKHDQSQSRQLNWHTSGVDVLYTPAATAVPQSLQSIEQGIIAQRGMHNIEQGFTA